MNDDLIGIRIYEANAVALDIPERGVDEIFIPLHETIRAMLAKRGYTGGYILVDREGGSYEFPSRVTVVLEGSK